MTTPEMIKTFVANQLSKHDGQNPIYIIMMLEKPGNEEIIYNKNGVLTPSGFPDPGATDEVGFYYELATAIDAITNNWCDIQDHAYQAAFLLCKFPGLYTTTTTKSRMYFVWDQTTQTFIQQEEPVLYKHIGL
jgi:hypothetical protein